MKPPLATVTISDFNGLVSNRGRFPETPSDALTQTNIRCLHKGGLSARKGLESVSFSTAVSYTDDLISIYFYDYSASTQYIVSEDANGIVDAETLA